MSDSANTSEPQALQASQVRSAANPNFCPPVQEGITFTLEDEQGECSELEFLGLVLHGDRRYGVFFPVTEEAPALSSGEVVILEAVELDEDGQPAAFELVDDEAILHEVYAIFQDVTADLYRFE